MSEGKPSLLITSGNIYYIPFPPIFSLPASEASQFNLCGSLAEIYCLQGVHVGTVVINRIVEEGEGKRRAKNVARELWKISEMENNGKKRR
jgi:hypothetical protein